jgi:hypothetical protein
MREHFLETRKPSCVPRAAKAFFILKACGPQTKIGHVTEPKPALAGRRGPGPWDTWQH